MSFASRRVTGRHLVLSHGGAAVDGAVTHDVALDWLANATRIAATVGLGPAVLAVRDEHVTLGLPSPPDLRDLAADVLDQAIGAEPEIPLVARPDLALRALLAAADEAALPAFHDEDGLTVGLGAGGRSWPLDTLPADIGDAHRIPLALITGTNGKTTTANLLGAIAAAAGHVPGVATSTGIRIGREWVEHGDWSGSGAARMVGRDPRVTLAVLETARGGLLRRGLLVDHADVAVLTNTSADHLGEWGITTVAGIARVKLGVAEALRPGGVLVTNGDDAVLTEAVQGWIVTRPDVKWWRFSSRFPADAWADRRDLHLPDGLVVPIAEVPLSLGGAARHNVENALAAALAARGLGLGTDAIAAGLRGVRSDPRDNPGRSNRFTVGGAQILVDYAHNPDGFARLGELAEALAPTRRLMLFGQAGDRTEEALDALAAAAAALGCARYVVKPLPGYARGRPPEEVVEMLRQGLCAHGVDPERIEIATGERDGVRRTLAAMRPGDLVLMLVHEDLQGAVAELEAAGATAG